MNNYTSLIPNNEPVSEPPEVKFLGIICSVIFCLLLLGIIVFVVFDFSMDITGHPIYSAGKPESAADLQQEAFIDEPESVESIAANIRLLSPLPFSTVSSSKFPVICTWAGKKAFPLLTMDLKIDGIPVQWEMQFGSNTWVVNVELEEGRHTIQTAAFDTEFFVGKTSDPKWKPLKMHNEIGNIQHCGDCHQWVDKPSDLVRSGHGLTVGAWKGSESCTACHNEPEFRKKHLPFAPPEENCQNCHTVHGTTK